MFANMNVLGKGILTYNWMLVYSYLFFNKANFILSIIIKYMIHTLLIFCWSATKNSKTYTTNLAFSQTVFKRI